MVVVVVIHGADLAREARATTKRWPALRHEQLLAQLQWLAAASTARLISTLPVRVYLLSLPQADSR